MERLKEGLVLETAWDMSINDLLAEQAVGRSVLRTPHVGNMSVHNMTLLDAGIPAWLVDYGIADRDDDYRPETVLQSGESTTIAAARSRLTCRTEAVDATSGAWLDEYHLASLESALPGITVETYTAYLRRHESVAGELFGIIGRRLPSSFTHRVTADGTRIQDRFEPEDVADRGVMQLTEDHRRGEAVMPTTTHNLLATFVIEALESRDDLQYHVSGSQLYRYVFEKATADKLNQMYQIVRNEASFGDQLPRSLKVMIVPARGAVLATTERRCQDLEALVESIDEYGQEAQLLEAERRELFGSKGAGNEAARQAFLRDVKKRRIAMHLGLLKVLVAQPEVVANRAADTFVTQYDVIGESGLYVAEHNRTMTMRQLTGLHKLLKGVAKSKAGRALLDSSSAVGVIQ